MKTKNTKGKKKNNSKKKNKFSFKEFINSTKFLTVVFVLLIILVIVLSILCYIKTEKDKKYKPSDISIPVLKSDTESGFGINAAALVYSKEYVFKITNYNKKEINKKKTDYKITIINNNDCVVKVTKDDSDIDLMKDQKETIITGSLNSEEKEEIYYHVKITSHGDLDGKDLISVEIDS